MKRLSFVVLSVFALAVCAMSACSASQPATVEIPAADPSISYMGRILWVDSLRPTFTYPGTTAAFNFRGTGVQMKAAPGSGQFMVEIDDMAPYKINFTETDSLITLADKLSDGSHSVRVVYAIEGYDKHPEFRGFVLSGANPAMLAPDPRPELKIEFIGNSITCGYGSEADSPTIHFSYDTENHTLSYAYLTSRALNADFNVVARSGIGIYRYYGGDQKGTDKTMPLEYDNTLLYVPEYKWDHESFHPDIICVNLGTNDTSLNTYDTELLASHYRDFVDHLLALHPDAKIVLLTGCMLTGKRLDDVKTILDDIASTRDRVYRLDLEVETGEMGYGADYHPSAARHRHMADELVPFLQGLIKK